MKYVFFFFALFFLFGCNDSSLECKESVMEKFPTAIEILKPSNEQFRFIVIDKDSSIYFVETMNLFNSKVTECEKLYSFGN